MKLNKLRIIKDYLDDYTNEENIKSINLVLIDRGKLYIGGLTSLDKINKYNINLIISLDPTNICINKIHLLKTVSIIDLENTIPIIHEFLRNNINTLIQCNTGCSKSAIFVIYYLMKYTSKDLIQSLKYLVKKRPSIYPDKNLLKLIDY